MVRTPYPGPSHVPTWGSPICITILGHPPLDALDPFAFLHVLRVAKVMEYKGGDEATVITTQVLKQPDPIPSYTALDIMYKKPSQTCLDQNHVSVSQQVPACR